MREILFRGQRADNKEWVEGYYSYSSDIFFRKNKAYIQTFRKLENGEILLTKKYEVIPETIGQYTGLTDKNGNKIFEGDILRDLSNSDYELFVVVFNKEYAKFEFKIYGYYEVDVYEGIVEDKWGEYDDNDGFDNWDSLKHFKIIGNIHDNPELLKGE